MKKYLRQKDFVMLMILMVAPINSYAATTSATLSVNATVAASCVVGAATLALGIYSLSADVISSTTMSITCTNTTVYNIGLDAGTGAGATVTNRKATSGANTIQYQLFRDNTRLQNWGNTVATDTLVGTGNGTAQSITIYSTLPSAQASAPSPGNYTDTVNITVTY